MIGPSYVRMIAAYNAEMNRRLYGAAARLPDPVRREARGAFWGSIHGTLAHLLRGDSVWMARFDSWPTPTIPLAESGETSTDFGELTARRIAVDAGITNWAARVDQAWIDADLVWMSDASRREMRAARSLLVMHFFNHQTHHRGQAHALITACGEATGDTDLFLVLDDAT